MSRLELKLLGTGGNWLNVSTIIALQLNGYNSPLGKDARISVTTMDPGVGSMEGPRWIDAGQFDVGITTPGWYGALAFYGLAPFERPCNIRGLALFPHDDRMVFAARKETGLRTVGDILAKKYPLRYSMPVSDNHPAIFGADTVLSAYGFSRKDIDSWGGRRLYDRPRFQTDPAEKPVSDEWEAIFDEAIMTPRWQNLTHQFDVQFLAIEDAVLANLESRGIKRAVIEKERFPQLSTDIPTIDFSDWLLFCRADVSNEVAYLIARAVDQQRDAFNNRIPPHSGLTGTVDPQVFLSKMPIPVHHGAAAYYKERGYT